MQITLPAEFNYVIWTSLFIGLQCFFTGFVSGGKRKNTFTKEFMEKNFGEEHRKAFPGSTEPPKGGYPDNGSGLYSKKLGYKEWFEFNLA
jgi:hypothetical protein